jgi:MEDS: MEthanogen/methylotroph, DcmR Sensory domain
LDDKLARALAENYEGLRLNGSTAWLQREARRDFQAFERALDGPMASKPIITLCNFPLAMIGADETLAAAQTHHFTAAIRKGIWQILETTEAEARTH